MKIKKFFLLVIIIFFLLPLVLAGDITRSFSSSGIDVDEEVTVSLGVDVDDDWNVYSIHEIVSLEAEIVSVDGLVLSDNHLRKVVFSNVEDVVLSYVIKFSDTGTYNFSGVYAYNDENSTSIKGDNNLEVSSGNGGNGNWGNGGNGGGGNGDGSICTPLWSCINWSDCIDNIKTRTCTDLNNCGSNVGKPVESQSCSTEQEPIVLDKKEEKSSLFTYIILGIIVILVVFFILIIIFIKSRK